MPEGLPPDLRAQIDAYLQSKPAARPLFDALLARHAAADSPQARARVEKSLRDVMAPSRAGWWLGGALLAATAIFVGWKMASQQRHEDALARSVPAVALVKRMDPGDCTMTARTARCLRLELEVHRDGAAPYTGSLTHSIDLEWMSRVQPGSWLTIGVDPDDPATLLFDERALAVAPPAPPSP